MSKTFNRKVTSVFRLLIACSKVIVKVVSSVIMGAKQTSYAIVGHSKIHRGLTMAYLLNFNEFCSSCHIMSHLCVFFRLLADEIQKSLRMLCFA